MHAARQSHDHADRNARRRVRGGSQLGQALKTRAEILRLSEAAHDAVLVPRDPGGLSHALARGAGGPDVPASRQRRAGRALRRLSGASRAISTWLRSPSRMGVCGDPLQDAMARHADLLTLAPRKATRDDIEALKAAGLGEADIVRLVRACRLRELSAAGDRRSQTPEGRRRAMSETIHSFTANVPTWSPYVTPVDLATATPEQLVGDEGHALEQGRLALRPDPGA